MKPRPKRTAHINTRGMLITDARQFNANPFYPERGTGSWVAVASGVTMSADDNTDRNLRRLEPLAHDALHYKQLDNPDEVEQVHKELLFLQKEINRISGLWKTTPDALFQRAPASAVPIIATEYGNR